jgi:hypothetical protein
MTAHRYDSPMPVGDRLVVRIRRVRLGERLGPLGDWVGFRITHPHGRRSLAGQDFPIEGQAERFARDRGWTVLGVQR